MDREYYWIYCPSCNLTLVYEAGIEDNGGGYETVSCPECGSALDTVRADDGCDCIGIACGYIYPGKPCCGAG